MSEHQWSDLTKKRVAKFSEDLKKKPEEIFAGIKAIYDELTRTRPDITDLIARENKARFEWYRRTKSGFGPSTAILFEGIIWGPGEASDMNQFTRWQTSQDYEDADAKESNKCSVKDG